MTWLEDIEEAFDEYVFQHVDVRAITERVLKYEFTDASERENKALFWKGELNFFEFVVTRTATLPLIGGPTTTLDAVSAEVRYTIQKISQSGNPGENYRRARDAISTVIDRVVDGLGTSWRGNVDYYLTQENPSEISESSIAGVECWRTIYRFRAERLT